MQIQKSPLKGDKTMIYSALGFVLFMVFLMLMTIPADVASGGLLLLIMACITGAGLLWVSYFLGRYKRFEKIVEGRGKQLVNMYGLAATAENKPWINMYISSLKHHERTKGGWFSNEVKTSTWTYSDFSYEVPKILFLEMIAHIVAR